VEAVNFVSIKTFAKVRAEFGVARLLDLAEGNQPSASRPRRPGSGRSSWPVWAALASR